MSGGQGGAVGEESPGRLLLAPDLFLECQEIVLQITDDPFEVKLKANYEVCVSPSSTCTPAISKEAIRLVHAVARNNSDLNLPPNRNRMAFKCQ